MWDSGVLWLQVENCENQLRQLELTSQQLLQVSAEQVSPMLVDSPSQLAAFACHFSILHSVHMHGLFSKVPQQTSIAKPLLLALAKYEVAEDWLTGMYWPKIMEQS